MQRAKRLLVATMICVLAAISISLVACNNGHDHKFDKWDYDDTYHWKVCSVEGCTEKDDATKAKHELNANGKCECGYEKAPSSSHEHTYEDGKWIDQGGGKHAKRCDDNDYTDNTTAEDHTFVEGKCSKCDAVEPHTHTYTEDKWVDQGDGTCAPQCDDEEYIDEDNAEAHTYVEGKCERCEAVEPHTHIYTEGKWADQGGGKHAKQCDLCDYKDEDTAVDHTEFDTVITDPQEHWDECVVCHAEKTGSREEHDFETVTTDPEEHWNECECGAEEADSREAHEFELVPGDETEHWKECECGAEKANSRAAHGFAEATEYVDLGNGKHAAKCPTCGAGNEAAPEDHHFGDTWVDQGDGTCAKECAECDALDDVKWHRYVVTDFDEDDHWNKCLYCGLEAVGSREEHNFDDGFWIVIYEGANEGKHGKQCATCEAVDEDTIHEADFDGEFLPVAGGRHAQQCQKEECNFYDWSHAQAHVYEKDVPVEGGNGETTKVTVYVDLGNGTCAKECQVCNYQDTAKAEKHDYQQTYDSSEHWNACSRCALEETDTRASHSGELNQGDDTFHWRDCDACGAQYSKVGHSVDMGIWFWDNESHYHACVTCGGKRTAETRHVIDWTVVNPATCQSEGSKTGKCSTSGCEYTTEENIPIDDTAHVYDDSNGYAEECSVCGKPRPTINVDPKYNDKSIFKLSSGSLLTKNTSSSTDTTALDNYVDALGEEVLILPAKFNGTIVTGTNDMKIQ